MSDDFPLNNMVVLSQEDRRIIIDGEWLTDIHINAAQKLLKRQFPNLSGLLSSLVVPKLKDPIPAGADALQIIHTRGNHWIVACTIGCPRGEVRLFDSLYQSIDTSTMALLLIAFVYLCLLRTIAATTRRFQLWCVCNCHMYCVGLWNCSTIQPGDDEKSPT